MSFRLSRVHQLSRILTSPKLPQPTTAILTRAYAAMAPDHSQWKLNHTMLRIKDPKKSLDYYKLLGLSLVNKLEFPDNKFDLYFLGMPSSTEY